MTNPEWAQRRRQVSPEDYDEQWARMAAAGQNPHGEADLVCRFDPATVLDGGCGTGRVAVELARRGIDVVGVDLDTDLLDRARAKAPELTWVEADLATMQLGRTFDVVVLAGNVIPFVAPERRGAAVAGCAHHLSPGGRLVAGFQLSSGWPTLDLYDRWCAEAGLETEARFATWDAQPWSPGGDYAVTVSRSGP